ncbi:MAG: hypothetical protein JSV20_05880 [Candidatus Bathyarchaeota archaeon]|nr:MAG: hypothetical protein JSV20_05880 [Candidatus Bathyarchaeota archaeon]
MGGVREITYDPSFMEPQIGIGGVLIPRLILGHLPFLGESYQGLTKNQEYREKFSKMENIVSLLQKAVTNYGVTAVACTPAVEGRLSATLRDALRRTIRFTSVEIGLIPCFMIPLRIGNKPVDVYRRWVTYYAYQSKLVNDSLLKKYINDPILRCRAGWKTKFQNAVTQLQPYSKEEIDLLRIDFNVLNDELRSLDSFKILLAEPGSENDFLALTGRLDLLETFANVLRDRLQCPVLLASHHAGSSISILETSQILFDGYLTPVNKLGVMMFPTQKMAIHAIKQTTKPVVAIKPLAGGRIPPKEAFDYIFKNQQVEACMVGIGSEAELDKDFRAAYNALHS